MNKEQKEKVKAYEKGLRHKSYEMKNLLKAQRENMIKMLIGELSIMGGIEMENETNRLIHKLIKALKDNE